MDCPNGLLFSECVGVKIWLRDDFRKGFPGLDGEDIDWYCG